MNFDSLTTVHVLINYFDIDMVITGMTKLAVKTHVEVDLLAAGYPCVCLSSLNASPKSFEDAEFATGSGYFAVMGYIKRNKPPLVALENVRGMLQKRKQDNGARPIDIQNKRMHKLGYESSYTLANTCEYGLPQSRNRVWMLYVRKDQLKTNQATLESDMKSFYLCFWEDVLFCFFCGGFFKHSAHFNHWSLPSTLPRLLAFWGCSNAGP